MKWLIRFFVVILVITAIQYAYLFVPMIPTATVGFDDSLDAADISYWELIWHNYSDEQVLVFKNHFESNYLPKIYDDGFALMRFFETEHNELYNDLLEKQLAVRSPEEWEQFRNDAYQTGFDSADYYRRLLTENASKYLIYGN